MTSGASPHIGRPLTALEDARRAAGFSRERLAGLAGVTARTIYAHEVEGVMPHPATRHVIAEALGCTPADLFPRLLY